MARPSDTADAHDPFAPVEASPRGATGLVVVAVVAAVLAAIGGVAPIAGPVGMASGLIAHVKRHRLGFPAACLAGVAMVVGFTITFWLR